MGTYIITIIAIIEDEVMSWCVSVCVCVCDERSLRAWVTRSQPTQHHPVQGERQEPGRLSGDGFVSQSSLDK